MAGRVRNGAFPYRLLKMELSRRRIRGVPSLDGRYLRRRPFSEALRTGAPKRARNSPASWLVPDVLPTRVETGERDARSRSGREVT